MLVQETKGSDIRVKAKKGGHLVPEAIPNFSSRKEQGRFSYGEGVFTDI